MKKEKEVREREKIDREKETKKTERV